MKKILKLLMFVGFAKKNSSDKVRDHCHLTGKYRGAAHSKCSIKVTHGKSNTISIIFYNFTNSDCHLFS